MLLPLSLTAQTTEFSKDIAQFEKLSEKYADNDAVTTMSIDRNMLAMFAGDNEMLDNIGTVVIILTQDTSIADKIVAESNKIIRRIDAEQLIAANHEGQNIAVYISKDEDIITRIMVTISSGGSEESGVIAISCRLPEDMLDQVVKIANNL